MLLGGLAPAASAMLGGDDLGDPGDDLGDVLAMLGGDDLGDPGGLWLSWVATLTGAPVTMVALSIRSRAGGELCTLQVPETATIKHVKLCIWKRCGVDIFTQHLLLPNASSTLGDDTTMQLLDTPVVLHLARMLPRGIFHLEPAGPRWRKTPHFGGCSQSCGCCRWENGEGFGACLACQMGDWLWPIQDRLLKFGIPCFRPSRPAMAEATLYAMSLRRTPIPDAVVRRTIEEFLMGCEIWCENRLILYHLSREIMLRWIL